MLHSNVHMVSLCWCACACTCTCTANCGLCVRVVDDFSAAAAPAADYDAVLLRLGEPGCVGGDCLCCGAASSGFTRPAALATCCHGLLRAATGTLVRSFALVAAQLCCMTVLHWFLHSLHVVYCLDCLCVLNRQQIHSIPQCCAVVTLCHLPAHTSPCLWVSETSCLSLRHHRSGALVPCLSCVVVGIRGLEVLTLIGCVCRLLHGLG